MHDKKEDENLKKNYPRCFYCGRPIPRHKKMQAEACIYTLSIRLRELTGFENDDEMRDSKN